MKTLLLTGGTGYIGSHCTVDALEAGYEVIIFDNLTNSQQSVIDKIQSITGKSPKFYHGDLRNLEDIEAVFRENSIDAVLHFAGLKAVGESTQKPFEYYENNVTGSMNLLQVMKQHQCRNIIFSSTASVYNPFAPVPFSEETPTGNTTNPYATSKYIVENMLRDLALHSGLRVINLRYFNPIGAHQSGLIGEDPNDIPNNLLPYVMKVANGELPELRIFGDDYDTRDGTGVRDYIHISDLVSGHMAALEYIQKHTITLVDRASAGEMQQISLSQLQNPNMYDHETGFFEIFNLGRGEGSSVLEILHWAREVTGKEIPSVIAPRRPGDIGDCYCRAGKAKIMLGWEAHKSVYEGIEDSWNFICKQNKG